jgi:protein TonB
VTRPVTAAWVALAHLVGLGALLLASVISPNSPPKALRVQLAGTLNTPKAEEAPRTFNSRQSSVPSTFQEPVVAPQPALNPQPPLSSNLTLPPSPAPPQGIPQETNQVVSPTAPQAAQQAAPKIISQTVVRSAASQMPVATSTPGPAATHSSSKVAADDARPPSRLETTGDVRAKADSPPLVDASFSGNRPPDYPAMSRRIGEQGVVALRVMIGIDGRASEVLVTRSSGSARLDQAAIAAIRQWRFIPAQQGGRPVSQWYDWRWEFRLKD